MEEEFTLLSDTFSEDFDILNPFKGVVEFLDDYKKDLNFKFRRKFRTKNGIKYSKYYIVRYPLKDLMFDNLCISMPFIKSIMNRGDK